MVQYLFSRVFTPWLRHDCWSIHIQKSSSACIKHTSLSLHKETDYWPSVNWHLHFGLHRYFVSVTVKMCPWDRNVLLCPSWVDTKFWQVTKHALEDARFCNFHIFSWWELILRHYYMHFISSRLKQFQTLYIVVNVFGVGVGGILGMCWKSHIHGLQSVDYYYE